MTDTIYKHQEYSIGFEVSTEQLKQSAAKAGLTLEEYLIKLERAFAVGVEIWPLFK